MTTITSPSCWGTHFLYLSNPPSGNLLPIIPCSIHCETSGRFIDGYIPVLDVSGAVDGLVVGLGVLLGSDLLDLLQPRAATLVLADTAGPAPGPLQT